jgi:hypothetical protein
VVHIRPPCLDVLVTYTLYIYKNGNPNLTENFQTYSSHICYWKTFSSYSDQPSRGIPYRQQDNRFKHTEGVFVRCLRSPRTYSYHEFNPLQCSPSQPPIMHDFCGSQKCIWLLTTPACSGYAKSHSDSRQADQLHIEPIYILQHLHIYFYTSLFPP